MSTLNIIHHRLDLYHGNRNTKLKNFYMSLGMDTREASLRTWLPKHVNTAMDIIVQNPPIQPVKSDVDWIAGVRASTFAEYKASKCMPACGKQCDTCRKECPFEDEDED